MPRDLLASVDRSSAPPHVFVTGWGDARPKPRDLLAERRVKPPNTVAGGPDFALANPDAGGGGGYYSRRQPGDDDGSRGELQEALEQRALAERQRRGPSRNETRARAVSRGVSVGMDDELLGTMAAASDDPVTSLMSRSMLGPLARLASGGVNLALNTEGARDRYSKTSEEVKSRYEQGAELYPADALAGEIGGALLTAPVTGGLGLAAKGAGVFARAGAGMRAGGLYGLAYGAGTSEGNPVERAPQAAMSGAFGATVGGALPFARGALNLAATPFKQTARTVRGMFNQDKEAVRRVSGALQRDQVPPGTVPAKLAAAQAEGIPLMVADAGGNATRRLARDAVNTSPEAANTIGSAIAGRQSTQRDRFINYLSRWQRASLPATREALEDAARKANRPAYQRAYAAGDRPVMTEGLERLLGAPAVVDALKKAAESGKDRAIADGFGSFNSAVRFFPDGRIGFQGGKAGVPSYPNLQLWDYTYRGLRDAADKAFRSGANSEGQYLKQLAQQLRKELDNAVPEFRNARGTAALFFGAEDALEAGQKFALSRMGNAEARQGLAKLSPAERVLFEEGFIDTIIRRVAEGNPNKNVIDEIFLKSPAAKERIAMVLGPNRTSTLEAYLRYEHIMGLLKSAMGNSTTAQQLAAFGAAGGVGSAATTGDWSWHRIGLGALLGGAARQGLVKVDQRVVQKVAELLTIDDPQAAAKAFNMISASSALQQLMRIAEVSAARIAGQQTPGLSRLAITGSGNMAPEDYQRRADYGLRP